LASDALRADCVSEPADDGEVLRYRKQPEAGAEKPAAEAPAAQGVQLPAWLNRAAVAEQPKESSVTPSNALEDEEERSTAGAANALLRGSLVHRLLQSLPDIPLARRRAAMADYLARAGAQLPSDEREQIAEQVLRVLADPRFGELFAPDSRAEVPLVGRLQVGEGTIRVSGQIDRLAIAQSSVLIADFKTTRPAPRRFAEVPPAYVTQLALYRALLVRLYPDRPVRAALIWTEVPDLMELSVEMLDAALTRVTSA
jgi:ATP-dependent helicase/nuclease subunit A